MVIDSETNEPLPFASVLIKDSKTWTKTDLDGKFKLEIPDSLLSDNIYLVITYIGYKQAEIKFNKNNLPITIDLVIDPSEQVLLGEVIYVKKKKWWLRKKSTITE